MLSDAQLDEILALQLAVAWAGEAADDEDARLGWWQTDLVSEFGGIALLERVAPRTAVWAAYETAREAARRVDRDRRSSDAKPDSLRSLFHFGFVIDEQLDDRLLALKHRESSPAEALAGFAALPQPWDPEQFFAWLERASRGVEAKAKREPSGLRVVSPPDDPVARARCFARLLSTAGSSGAAYPCPHVRDVANAEAGA